MTARPLRLPPTGRYTVDTVDDTYEINVDTKTAVWLNMRRDGLGECVEPADIEFDTIDCTVGCFLSIDGQCDGPGSLILGITPIEVAA